MPLALSASLGLGFAAIILHSASSTSWRSATSAFVFAMAALATGGLLGLLFGVPRTVEREAPPAAGYSCPGTGQVTGVARLYTKPFEQRLIFAGEHTCLAFFGYMEGALESGLLAARQVAFARGLMPEDWAVTTLRQSIARWSQ